jgi:environmental stress-induced protein Ves
MMEITRVLHVLRARDVPATPWKNGGGVTREIAVHPQGAGFDDFVWRLSMATVSADGPFSIFPGIDRTLLLLDGDGIELVPQGRQPVTLKPGDRLDFDADHPVASRLLGATVTDLNIMTRRGHAAADVASLSVGGAASVELSAGTGFLFCLAGDVEATAGSQSFVLGRHDTLRFDGDGPQTIGLRGNGEVCIIGFRVVDPR